MNRATLVQVLVVNAVLIPLLVLITENYASRMAYWKGEVLTPTMTRYPFFYITSAAGKTANIPGLLTVDWQQIVLVLLVVTDVLYAWSLMKSGKRGMPRSP